MESLFPVAKAEGESEEEPAGVADDSGREAGALAGKGEGIWKCPSHSAFTPDSGWTSSYGYNWQYLLAPGKAPDAYPHADSGDAFGNPGVSLAFLAHPGTTVCFIDQTLPL